MNSPIVQKFSKFKWREKFLLSFVSLITCILFILMAYPSVLYSMDAEGSDVAPMSEGESGGEDGGEENLGTAAAAAASADAAPMPLGLQGPLRDSRVWVSSFRFQDIPYDPIPWHIAAGSIIEDLGQNVRTSLGARDKTNTALARLDLVFDDDTVIPYGIPFAFLSGSASQNYGRLPPISFIPGEDLGPVPATTASASMGSMLPPPVSRERASSMAGSDEMGITVPGAPPLAAAAAAAASGSGEGVSYQYRSLIDYWHLPPSRASEDPSTHKYHEYRTWLRGQLFSNEVEDLDDRRREVMRGIISPGKNDRQAYLHSEPTVLSYLQMDGVVNSIAEKVEQVARGAKTLKVVVLNISSFLDICPNCATTLFLNSALRRTFMEKLIDKLRTKDIKINPGVKLVNLVSSVHEHFENGGRSSRYSKEQGTHMEPLSTDRLPSWVLQMTLEDLRRPVAEPLMRRQASSREQIEQPHIVHNIPASVEGHEMHQSAQARFSDRAHAEHRDTMSQEDGNR